MIEADIERYFVRQVEKRKGEVRKVKWIGRRHAPDRLALFPLEHFLVELKRPGAKARDGQSREHERLRKAGFRVFVLDTKEQIDELFYHIDRGFLPNALRP